MPSPYSASVHHGETGLTRFSPNVEQITIKHETTCSWLIVRRNDQEWRFPLCSDDRDHLAALLLDLDETGAARCKELRISAAPRDL